MHILKKPDLSDPKLRAKLAKGMGHNYYGEPAWPNDLLYIFPVVILGTIACVVGLAVLDPAMLGDKADPFATPLEILPEWYLYPVFQILRVVPNKLLGIALQTMIPLGLMLIPFIESFNKFQNPFRRPVAMAAFLFGTLFTIYLGIGAALPIDKSPHPGPVLSSDPTEPQLSGLNLLPRLRPGLFCGCGMLPRAAHRPLMSSRVTSSGFTRSKWCSSRKPTIVQVW